MSQDPLAAVRERISDLKDAAAMYFGTHEGEVMEWAATALEAMLEAVPCDRCNARRDRHPIRNIGEREPHDFVFSARLEAALTRATATTEGAR